MERYYESETLHSKNGMEGMLLINFDGTYQLFIKDTNLNIWKAAGPNDIQYFTSHISAKNTITDEIPLNNYIGFITSTKRKDFSSLVFKTKKIKVGKTKAQIKGSAFATSIASRCDQAGRATTEKNIKDMLESPKVIEILDALPKNKKDEYYNYGIERRRVEGGGVIPLPEEVLLQLFINHIPLDSSKPLTDSNNRDTNEIELCILQEFILRYFDIIYKDGKRWFLTPIQVLLNKIETLR